MSSSFMVDFIDLKLNFNNNWNFLCIEKNILYYVSKLKLILPDPSLLLDGDPQIYQLLLIFPKRMNYINEHRYFWLFPSKYLPTYSLLAFQWCLQEDSWGWSSLQVHPSVSTVLHLNLTNRSFLRYSQSFRFKID